MSATLTSRVRKLRQQVAYIPATLRLIRRAAHVQSIAWMLLLVLQGIIPAVQLLLIRALVDAAVEATGGGFGMQELGPVALYAGLMGATIVFALGADSAIGWLRTAQAELTRDYLTDLIHQKAVSLDLAFYEMPLYHDLLERVRGDLRERPLAMLESLGQLARSGITLVAMAAILLSYGPWLPILLLVSASPVLLVVVRHNLLYHRWWQETTVVRRWSQYYDTILTLDAAAAEIRVFDLSPHFRGRYREMRERLRKEHLVLARRQNLANFGAGVGGLAVTAGAMGWMLWRALRGLATLGDVALLYQALYKGQSLMGSLMTSLGRIYSSTVFLGNLFEFLELEPEIVDPSDPTRPPPVLKEGIRFNGVTFRYPQSDRNVLEEFDFHIPAGKIVAIVGANGAGKTTLMKLLCRFYDPDEGAIEIDGIDLKDLPLPELRRSITGLFQFPIPYLATARENILVGDITGGHGDDDVVEAAKLAGAHGFIERLPQGYDTLMGKWFEEGTQLSGGEWQRLALARSFIRRAPIMILDEPTSHLDSWAEADWFDRLRTQARGSTTVLITHRFVTARHADVIHVMDQGRIIESGTHEEMIALGGSYARSWSRQTGEQPAEAT